MAALPRCPAHAPPSSRRHDHRPRLATPPAGVSGRPAARRTPITLTRSLENDTAAVLAAAAADASAGTRPSSPLPLPDWHPLADPPLWSGADESALGGDGGRGDDASTTTTPSPLASLPPAWRLLLLSDGSVTRHLQLLTGAAVEVEVLDQRVLESASDLAALPPSAREIAGPIVQRRVLLRVAAGDGGDGGSNGTAPKNNPALVFATSWWNVADAADTLATTARPIWTSLASTRSELFREIRGVECGGNAALGRAFGVDGRGGKGGGELWGRHYLFHRGGRPLTAIYEVFSPRLGGWLGVGGEGGGGERGRGGGV